MTDTLISSEVDLGRPGKQSGFLRVPHSVHRSAYGWIPVPVAIVANGDGPTVLLMAGNHGDEYEGPLAIMDAATSLDPAAVSGRIILIPFMNAPAVHAATRTSPIDGGNMNRVFPGKRDGTITEMIAHYVSGAVLDCNGGSYVG